MADGRPTKSKFLDTSKLVVLGRIFCAEVVQQFARTGESPLFQRLISDALTAEQLRSPKRVYDIFERAFEILMHSGQRHEYVFKDALVRRILIGRHSLKTAVLLSEFRVANCKVDLAILNGTSNAYEIKSDRDKLDRLERQLDAYLKAFARVTVVASERHIPRVLEIAPRDVGVLTLTNRSRLLAVRPPVERFDRIESAVIFDALPLSESVEILAELGESVPRLPNTEMHGAMRKIFCRLSSKSVHDAMVRVLRRSRNLASIAGVIEMAPPSLRAAILSTRIRSCDHQRLVAAIDASVLGMAT